MSKTGMLKDMDEYGIKARYIPTFLAVVPFVHFLIILVGPSFWSDIADSMKWMLISNFSFSLVLMVALVEFQCGMAKVLIEYDVFGEGGRYFPTTDSLLYSGGIISREMKDKVHDRIKKVFGCTLYDASQEEQDPENARDLAREAICKVVRFVDKAPIVKGYEIRYGFFRNLIGGVIFCGIGSLGSAVVYGLEQNWRIMSFFLLIIYFYMILYGCRKLILRRLSLAYADNLLLVFLERTEDKG